jgi:hypothetical protein
MKDVFAQENLMLKNKSMAAKDHELKVIENLKQHVGTKEIEIAST